MNLKDLIDTLKPTLESWEIGCEIIVSTHSAHLFSNDTLDVWFNENGVTIDYFVRPQDEPVHVLYSDPDFMEKLERAVKDESRQCVCTEDT